MPVIVTVIYPGEAKFDMDYYLKTHMPLVSRTWGKHGLKTWRINTLKSMDPSQKAPYSVQADLVWESMEGVQKALSTDAKEVLDDVRNFSSEGPTLMVGEITGEGKGE